MISVVSPAGLERYYQALAELPAGPPDIAAIKDDHGGLRPRAAAPAPGGLTMRVAVIGAGVAGLATAKVLAAGGPRRAGLRPHPGRRRRVERDPPLPGPDHAEPEGPVRALGLPDARRLPRVADRRSRCRPGSPPTPTHFATRRCVLSTEVRAARPDRRRLGAGPAAVRRRTEVFDRLVVANGVFCEPAVPDFPGAGRVHRRGRAALRGHRVPRRRGRARQARARGRLRQVRLRHHRADQRGRREHHRDRPADAVEGAAQGGGRPQLQDAAADQDGRGAVPLPATCAAFEKFLHGPGNGARRRLLNGLGTVSVRQFRLRELGLVPPGQMEDIVRGAIGLATEGFFEGVAAGRIDVRRDCTITRLLARRRPTGRRALRRHDAARRPRRLRHRLHPGRAVPRRGRAGAPARHPRQLPALPPDPAAGRPRAVLQRLQLVVLQPAQRRDGRGVDRGRPRRRACRCPDPEAMRGAVFAQLAFMDEATTGTTAAAGRSSRSRCTTSTRCSTTSASTSRRGCGRATGSTRSTRRRTATSPPRSCASSRRTGVRPPLTSP